jgi:uncharacterized protein YbjQ (UPF0145 family)
MLVTTTNDVPGSTVAMRYDSNELDRNLEEAVAYGTAVVLAG